MGKKNVYTEYAKQMNASHPLVQKHSPLLEHVEEKDKAWVACLIENQKNQAKIWKENKLNEAQNTTGDVATMEKNIMPMITRAMPAAMGAQVFGLQPLNADTGVFFYEQNFYSNDAANPVEPVNGKILVVADGSVFAVSGAITNSTGATGVVRYKEGNKIYVEVTAGSFAATDSLDNANPYAAEATTCSAVFEPEIGMQVFADYSAFSTIALGEVATTNIKEIELGIGKDTVTAVSHKLRMRYTWELLNRLKDYFAINGEDVTDAAGTMAFTQGLNMQVMNLIDTYALAGGISTFDYSATTGRWEIEKYKELLAHINRRSSDILTDSHMGLGNYIKLDPRTWAALDAYNYIDKSDLPGGMADPARNPYVGVLLGRYKVFVDIWQTSTYISMGFKDFSGAPDAELRAGAFFCPYLPVQSIKTVDSGNGEPVKYFTSFYAFKSHPFATKNGSGNAFFRKINCTHMPL